jgi:hypothetical protein
MVKDWGESNTFVSFISLICQNALLNPAFQMLRIVRLTLLPCDLYPLLIGGWVLSTDDSGIGFPIVPRGADLAGTLDE